jgi:large subunit ribosomal protein L4
MADKEEKTEDQPAEDVVTEDAVEADAEEAVAEDSSVPAEAATAAADAEAEAEAEVEEAKPEAKEKATAKPARKKTAKKAKSKKKKKVAAEVKVPEVKTVAAKDMKLNPDVFEVEARVGVIHEVVRAEMAARRKGSASTKTRSEVRGGGAKPWRQKGTGRARAGSSRMPHWTGGGVTFGPTPRDFSFKVNRKMRSKAMKMALSVRAGEGNFKVVESLDFEEPKSAAAAALLVDLDVTYPLLVLLDEADVNAALSFRNLPRVDVIDTTDLAVSDIIGARTVLVTRQALEHLNGIGEGK